MSIRTLTFPLLCLLVFAIAAALRYLAQEVAWMRRLDMQMRERNPTDGLPTGTKLPQFATRVLRQNHLITLDAITSQDLAGDETTLMFVSPADQMDRSVLLSSLHGLWHKCAGRLIVLCSGPEQNCLSAVPDEMFHIGGMSSPVAVLADPKGVISAACNIRRTPAALTLDSENRVKRYGAFRIDFETQS